MNLPKIDIGQKVEKFVSENSTLLLTAGGVVGTVATGVLAARAGIKAQQIIDAEKERRIHETLDEQEARGEEPHTLPPQLTKTETLLLVGPYFIPPVVTGGLTIAAIVFSHRMSAQKAAALAAAYGVSQNQFAEYRAKVEEKLGIKKEEALRDEVQQDRFEKNRPTSDVIIIGSGDVLCYDAWSGRYFKSTVEAIRKAENAVHQEIMNSNEAPLRTFYDALGLLPVGMDGQLGWNLDYPMSMRITPIMNPDETEPCLAIEFTQYPVQDYGDYRRHG